MLHSVLQLESDRLLKDWEELYQSADQAHPFQSPAWVKSWHQLDHARRPILFATTYEGKDLISILPLIRTPLWLRPAAMGPSDFLNPLARTGTSGLTSLQQLFQDLGRRQAVLLPRQLSSLPIEDRSLDFQIDQLLEGEALSLQFDQPFEAYFQGLSKSLRADIRKGMKSPDFQIETFKDEACLNRFDDFVRLHRARWRAKGQPGAFPPSRVNFHKTAIAAGLKTELRFAKVHGQPLAAIYLLKSHRGISFYQAGMASAEVRRACGLSPGSLLIHSAIAEAYQTDLQFFDFLRGNEAYKLRWKPNRKTPLTATLLTPRSPTGFMTRSYFKARFRAERAIRNRMEPGSLPLTPAPSSP